MSPVRLEHSKKSHLTNKRETETLCGVPRSQIMDGGDWWFVDGAPTCLLCLEMTRKNIYICEKCGECMSCDLPPDECDCGRQSDDAQG